MPPIAPLLALRLVFALNGLGLALWLPRIPDVKDALGADLMTLALCFFMLPVGTMCGFVVAPRVLSRYGTRAVCRWAGAGFILSFVLPALARDAVQLGAALLTAGLAVGSIEVAMNAKATELERTLRRRIMSSCHAFWSLGGMTGAMLGGLAGQAGVPFLAQQLLLTPVFAALAFRIAGMLPGDAPVAPAPGPMPRRGLPTGPLLALCLLPIGALMIEGAMMEWSALFLAEAAGLGALPAGAVFAAFASSMAGSRMAGDRLAGRFGPGAVLVGSALLAGAGVVAFATARTLPQALPAAAVLGLGIANVYPLAMSLSAAVPGRRVEDSIATVAFTAFSAFLIGPPLIGFAGSALGLPAALLLLAPLALSPLLLIRPVLQPPLPEEPPCPAPKP
ncbi:MFS transporter [Halovulum marinum]|uniref:MFS transporter n=1 Tax=Halovulum marinum TaxID=2662447 RepID=UPI001F41952E|nr:MFS transporter [Halovulum marinum]